MNQPSPANDERLSAYLDNELSPQERAEFEKLLAEREDYRQALDELKTVSLTLRDLPQPSTSGEFANRVMARIQEEHATTNTVSVTGAVEPANSHSNTKNMRAWFWPLAAIAASLLTFMILPSFRGNPNVALNETSQTADVTGVEEDSEIAPSEASLAELGAKSEIAPASEAHAGQQIKKADASRGAAAPMGEMRQRAVQSSRTDDADWRELQAEAMADSIAMDETEGADQDMMMDDGTTADVPAPMAIVANPNQGDQPTQQIYDVVAEISLEDPEVKEQFYQALAANNVQISGLVNQQSNAKDSEWNAAQAEPAIQQNRNLGGELAEADEEASQITRDASNSDNSNDSKAILITVDESILPDLFRQLTSQAIGAKMLVVNETTVSSESQRQLSRLNLENLAMEKSTDSTNQPVKRDLVLSKEQTDSKNTASWMSISNEDLFQCQQSIVLQNSQQRAQQAVEPVNQNQASGKRQLTVLCCPTMPDAKTPTPLTPAPLDAEQQPKLK